MRLISILTIKVVLHQGARQFALCCLQIKFKGCFLGNTKTKFGENTESVENLMNSIYSGVSRNSRRAFKEYAPQVSTLYYAWDSVV
jgi:hypothetical protein